MDLSEQKSFAVLCNLPIFSHNAIVWQLVNSKFLNLVGPSVLQGDGRVPWLTLELQGLGHIVIRSSRALALLRVENWDQQYQQARERHVGKNSFEILHSGGIVGTEKVNGE